MSHPLGYETFTQAHLSDEYIHSIGLITSEWGYVEVSIEYLIWALAKIEASIGPCVTTHIPTITRMDIIKTLTNELISDKELKKRITNMATEFERIRVWRNNIVHAFWIKSNFLGDWQTVSSKTTAKGKLKITHEHYEQKDIVKVAHDMFSLIIEIQEITRLVSNYWP